VARYQPGLKTEARIVDATRELLGEVGLDGTTLKAICDRAGVRAGSFYNLFPTKEAVVLRVVREAITAVDPHPDGADDSLDELIGAYLRFVTETSPLAKIYLQMAIAGGLGNGEIASRISRHHHARVARFSAAIAKEHPEIRAEEAEARASLLLATLNGLLLAWIVSPDFDLVGHVRLATAEYVDS
jgi:AcrR family transcriptional regulator